MASTTRLLEAAEYLYTVDQSNLFLQSLIEAVFAPSVVQFYTNILPQGDKSTLFSTLDKRAIEDIQEMLLFTSITGKASNRYFHAAKEYLHYHQHRLLPDEKIAHYNENAFCITQIDKKEKLAKIELLRETKKQVKAAADLIKKRDLAYFESIVSQIESSGHPSQANQKLNIFIKHLGYLSHLLQALDLHHGAFITENDKLENTNLLDAFKSCLTSHSLKSRTNTPTTRSPFFIIEALNKLHNVPTPYYSLNRLPDTQSILDSQEDHYHFNPAVQYNNKASKGKIPHA